MKLLDRKLTNNEIVEILYQTYIVLDPSLCFPDYIIEVEGTDRLITVYQGEIWFVNVIKDLEDE